MSAVAVRVSGPDLPAAGRLDPVTVAAIAAIAGLLIAGYVVLAALGRDTTGYLAGVAGPVLTTVIGGLLVRRVASVAGQVAGVASQSEQLSVVDVPALHSHLAEQDQQLDVVLEAVAGDVPPATAPDPRLPAARQPNAGGLQPLWPVYGSGSVQSTSPRGPAGVQP